MKIQNKRSNPLMRLLVLFVAMACTHKTYAEYHSLDLDGSLHLDSWISYLPDTMRLSQMSIPYAHDAATWNTILSHVCDQDSDEKTLFKSGVRAFDMRLGDGGKMHHGVYSLETYENEIKDHLPSLEQIGNDFMILWIRPEGDFSGQWPTVATKAFQHFLDLLVKKYPEDRFVYFSPDTQLKDVRGKIMILTPRDYCNSTESNPLPVTFIKEIGFIEGCQTNDLWMKKYGIYHRKPEEGTQGLGPPLPYQWIENEYQQMSDASLLVNRFKNAMNYHHSLIDYENSQNLFMFNYLNGYGIFGAQDVAVQANSKTPAITMSAEKPLGIVAYDFCDVYQNGLSTEGNFLYMNSINLTKEIVRHNFIRNAFISDIAVTAVKSRGDNGMKQCAEILSSHGYTPSYLDLKSHTSNKYTYMLGVKYTQNPDEAITGLTIMRVKQSYQSKFNERQDNGLSFTLNGKEYYPVTALNDKDPDLRGDLLRGEWDADNFYLMYSKDNQDCHLRVLTPFIFGGDYPQKEEHEKFLHFSDFNGGEGMSSTSEDADLNKGIGGDYVYLRAIFHTHSSPSVQSISNTEHANCCFDCKSVVDGREAHSFSYETVSPVSHRTTCSACNYKHIDLCTSTEGFVNGIAFCDKCNNPIYEKPDYAYREYEICNAGQLFWFARQVNMLNPTLKAHLGCDIDLENKTFNPIGTTLHRLSDIPETTGAILDEMPTDSFPDYLHMGFQGMFDGRGHTISNIRINGGSSESEDYGSGLFGFVNGGTIRHLRLVSASITDPDVAGTLAGQVKNGIIENISGYAPHLEAPIAGMVTGAYTGSTIRNVVFEGDVYPNPIIDHSDWKAYAAGQAVSTGESSSNTLMNIYLPDRLHSYKDVDDPNIHIYDDVARKQQKSGELCLKLNGGRYNNPIWHQNIDAYPESESFVKDAYPTFDTSHGVIVPFNYEDKILLDFKPVTDELGKTRYSRSEFLLHDDDIYSTDTTFTATFDNVVYDRAGFTDGYYSFCLPFKVDVRREEFKKAYSMKPGYILHKDTPYIELQFYEHEDYVKAGTPFVVLWNENSETTKLTLTSAEPATITYPLKDPWQNVDVLRWNPYKSQFAVDFKTHLLWCGTYNEIPYDVYQYSLNADGSFSPRANKPLRALRAYVLLKIDGYSQARSVIATFTDADGQVTRIIDVKNETETRIDSMGVYTIMGHRLNDGTMLEDLPAGTYIINGKKVIKNR